MEEVKATISYDSTFSDLMLNLAAQGYYLIHVEYSGAGDDGSIDHIAAYKTSDLEFDEQGEFVSFKDRYNDYHDLSKELKEVVLDKVYNLVLNDAPDWYNNDGGGGQLNIFTHDASYKCDHYVNIMETEDYEFDGTIY